MVNIEDLVAKSKYSKPEAAMNMLLDNLDSSTIVPRPDKYYVFVYRAKTPNIQYDQHPVIKCTGVFKWGFIGYNFHWNESRRYTWNEVISNMYEVYDNQLDSVLKLPIMKVKMS